MDSLYICKYMHIYFQRILFEQIDSILSLDKPLGNNCKIKIYISEIGSRYVVFFFFWRYHTETNQNLSEKWIVFKGQLQEIYRTLVQSFKSCHVSFCISICNECCTQTNILIALNSGCYIVCNSYVLWCTLTFLFDI